MNSCKRIADSIAWDNQPPLVGRFFRYCLVGGTGVLVDMSVLYALAGAGMVQMSLIVSKVCAAELAMVNNFIWNHRWTFRGRSGQGPGGWALLKRFLKFNLICAGGILISALALKVFVHGLGMNLFMGNLFAIGLATFWNFGMNHLFTWRQKCVNHE